MVSHYSYNYWVKDILHKYFPVLQELTCIWDKHLITSNISAVCKNKGQPKTKRFTTAKNKTQKCDVSAIAIYLFPVLGSKMVFTNVTTLTYKQVIPPIGDYNF